MNAHLEPPLLTLHPVADAQHRWVAVLVEAPCVPAETSAEAVLDAAERWLADGLREALATLPCILPIACTAGTPDFSASPVILAGPTVLRVHLPDEAQAAQSALNAFEVALRPSQGRVHLLHDGLPASVKIPAVVQGQVAAGHPAIEGAPEGGTGPHLALDLAKAADAATAHRAGWNWLAGNYAQDVPASTRLAGGRGIMLKLLSQITLDADDADIEKTLKQDPSLSFQLLRLVNSAGVGARGPITTFRQAIATLGRRQLQRWLQLLLYAQQGEGQINPLLPVAAWRAAMMEALATAKGMSSGAQDAAFMVGMFSRLDILFGQSLADILTPLGLEADITNALLNNSGTLAPLFAVVQATERVLDPADPPGQHGAALDAALTTLDLDHAAWCQTQNRSMGWVLRICREL